MDGYKDFQGKTLDEAIREACSYFDAPREKLEIDIVQDAKSGIFGLVGVRKAKIRARRVQLKTTVEELVGRGRETTTSGDAAEGEGKPRSSRRSGKPVREKRDTAADGAVDAASTESDDAAPSRQPRADRSRSERQPRERRAPKPETASVEPDSGAESAEQAESTDGEQRERTGRRRRRGGRGRGRSQNGERAPQEATGETEQQETAEAAPAREPVPAAPRSRGQSRPAPARRAAPPVASSAEGLDDFSDGSDDATPEGLPDIPLADLDQELVRNVALEVTGKLVAPIIGEAALTVDLADGRIKVTVDCGDNSGLLIGREGQTLASIQYLASRIVARKLNAAVRVQLDTGDYRERQDEKLRELALALAEKARATGKPQSTRPLSSYHRRVVHLALQEEEDIVTRSKGDGPLKRVIVLKRRKSPAA